MRFFSWKHERKLHVRLWRKIQRLIFNVCRPIIDDYYCCNTQTVSEDGTLPVFFLSRELLDWMDVHESTALTDDQLIAIGDYFHQALDEAVTGKSLYVNGELDEAVYGQGIEQIVRRAYQLYLENGKT